MTVRMDRIEELDFGSSDISEDSLEEPMNNEDDAELNNFTSEFEEIQVEASLELHLKSSIPHTVCMTKEGSKIDIADEVTFTFSPKIDINKDVLITGSPVKKRRGSEKFNGYLKQNKKPQTKVVSLPPSPSKKLGPKKTNAKKNINIEEGKKEIEAKLREMRRTEINQVI